LFTVGSTVSDSSAGPTDGPVAPAVGAAAFLTNVEAAPGDGATVGSIVGAP
jgi:hypothetical protein